MSGSTSPRVLQREAALAALNQAVRGPAGLHSQACVRCGLCGESCHIYKSEPEPDNLPAAKADRVNRLIRRYHTLLGRLLPRLAHARDLDEAALVELTDAVHGRCTACGRCGLHCSMGLDVAAVIRAGRKVLAAAHRVPPGLLATVDNQIQTGNQMAITSEEFIETAAWLSEELALESGDPTARIPVDEPGKKFLYLVNPREVKFFPLSFQSAAGIFHAARESWTISSRFYDVTNYGFFAADDEAAGELTRRVLEEAKRLGAQEILLSECGHGFRAFRWEGANWLDKPYPLPVRSVLELVDDYLAEGRIQVDPTRIKERVTLHDPCNLVRWGGVMEPQRRILHQVLGDFVEMTPNHENNFCCGGGGGMLSNEEYGARRVKSGSIKAEQIRATGAQFVACPCHNCADQLIELSRVYNLGVEIKAVVELVYDALIWPEPVRGS